MHRRPLGDAAVGAVGLGAMPLSHAGRPAEDDAIAVIHAALDAGVTLIDTADAYCLGPEELGHGELLIAKALRAYGPADVVVATKGGHTRPSAGEWALDGRPSYLVRAAEDSRRRLGVDAIGLWQFHRPDPATPWAESMGALRSILDAGVARRVGISNASPAQIREAVAIVGDGLVSVQNELSPAFRSSEGEVDVCAELGLAFLPWSPLGGMSAVSSLGSDHAAFGEVASSRGVTPQQVCLAWLLAKGPHVIPIPGSSRPATISASAEAADLSLSADELALLG